MKRSDQQLLRLAVKTGALSPTIDAMGQMPAPEDEKRLFEDKMGDMAYQVFSAQHPDLVDSIITFKVLDSDIDEGRGMGAFILEHQGELLYVPTIISDNQLKPFDMVYSKETDRFVPLTSDWLEALSNVSMENLGEGTKLPETVATDVDIRNIIVPPTTGRYSYASVRHAAAATEPLGRRVHKLAQEMPPAPVPEGTQQSVGAAPGGFNPEEWAVFNEQFQRIHGTTPGQSLDHGMMDLDTMSKLYKSHQKTWQMGQPDPAAQQQPQQAAPQMMPPAMGGMKMANRQLIRGAQEVAEAAGGGFTPFKNTGARVQDLWESMGRGFGMGAATGGIAAARDRDITDVPNAMLRGGIGGAVMGPAMKSMGRAWGMKNTDKIDPAVLAKLTGTAGAVGGGMLGIQARPDVVSRMTAPSADAVREYYEEHPGMMPRYASDESVEIGLRAMLKHAMANLHERSAILPAFLERSPNVVKQAFALTLQADPRLLKTAADLYGSDVLVRALSPHVEKQAGTVEENKGLYVADKDTPADELYQSFGKAAPEAFRGIAMRGYYYKDTRPKLNLALQIQEFHDFTDAKEPGVYNLYKVEGKPTPALVLYHPLNLLGDDRHVYPEDGTKKVPVLNRRRRDLKDYEPSSLSSFTSNSDVSRSHEERRLALLPNGNYAVCTKFMGDQTSEVALKGTPLFKRVMSDDKAPVRAGMGCFVYKYGTHYMGTLPVKVSGVRNREDGTMVGTLEDEAGFTKKKFVIDPRSPLNRARRPKDQDFVLIPASWKWVPLKNKESASEFVRDPRLVSELLHNAMGSMGAHKAVATSAGQSMYAVDGGRTLDKKAALVTLAQAHNIHASAAEAMLKVAELTGKCRTYIARPDVAVHAASRIKVAQGAPMPGAPMPPAMAAPEPDPIGMAFGEVSDGLQSQMEQLQAMLGVLQMVQQRAAELSGESVDMQGMPQPPMGQPMTPEMAASPEAQMDPAMDPAMAGAEGGMAPAGAIMRTEEPSAMEIQNQVNPQFLQDSAQFADQGAFDAGAISSLTQDPSLRSIGSQYAANFEDSLDDLGRTLLTLYMQEKDLKEQLGDEAFSKLETELRDTFSNLGNLVFSLTHNTAMLSDAQAS